MADLTSIFGGTYSLPEPKRIEPPDEQLREAMIEAAAQVQQRDQRHARPQQARMVRSIWRWRPGRAVRLLAGRH